jgi:hypothetical protein
MNKIIGKPIVIKAEAQMKPNDKRETTTINLLPHPEQCGDYFFIPTQETL